MKAVVRDRYGGDEVLRLEDIERPAPGYDEVLVRVDATSINTADIDQLRGIPPIARLGTGLVRPRWRVPGLDVAGTVEEVGRSVTGLRRGDEVWADMFANGLGAYAEYVRGPATAFVPRPSGISAVDAATVPHSAVLALQALGRRRRLRAGMHVLVNGAGGCVGPFAIQIAKTLGAEVTGVDHGGKLEMIRSLGADHVIDYTSEDVTKNGIRYDFILDIAANRSVFSYRRSLRDGGVHVLVARNLSGFFGAALVGGLISVIGGKRMGVFMWEPNKRADLDFLGELITTERLKPLIDRTYPLTAVPEAIRHQADGLARGKLVITM
ncbi:MAG TPA: NAD(P)-dependent alcohol dehydrogenase [Acidimicrobiia bacterium]|nr:NAD(P)-dependent alcohol dehydrogenase [Acidimicrobiia bacterium]